jgi:hypothetical protein
MFSNVDVEILKCQNLDINVECGFCVALCLAILLAA